METPATALMFKSKNRIARIQPNLDSRAIVQRVRVVVIDDSPSDFPVEQLRGQGFSIDIWQDVERLELLDSGFYDIIILDIGGVGRDLDPQDEGAGLLRHIKQTNPAQVVVAYSGQSHESTRIPFFNLADQYLPKPASVLDWTETLTDLIQTRVTPIHYWDSLKSILLANEVPRSRISKLESAICKAAKTKSKTDASKIVNGTLGHLDNGATIVAIVAKILAALTVS